MYVYNLVSPKVAFLEDNIFCGILEMSRQLGIAISAPTYFFFLCTICTVYST